METIADSVHLCYTLCALHARSVPHPQMWPLTASQLTTAGNEETDLDALMDTSADDAEPIAQSFLERAQIFV